MYNPKIKFFEYHSNIVFLSFFYDFCMMQLSGLYISLGSNLGNRMEYLQRGINEIDAIIGTVQRIAPVFQTPALGFEGNPFYNTCISVQTKLPPEQVMHKLLEVEVKLGRIRSETYSNRTLDLDLLMYDDHILDSSLLQLPHPRMELRRFVLEPLKAIAPSKIHPVLQRTIHQLVEQCTDASEIQPIDLSLKHPLLIFMSQYHNITIEGNIGIGKTSLVKKLAKDMEAKLILERFADNPFLSKFYQNPKRYSFPLEMSFLADRFKQLKENRAQLALFSSGVITDYNSYKSLIFAQNTLEEDEFKLYRSLFFIMFNELPVPDLYVYLHASPAHLMNQIKKRGRDYERKIEVTYLEKIAQGYRSFIHSHPKWNIITVDCEDLDFVENTADYWTLLRRIKDAAS